MPLFPSKKKGLKRAPAEGHVTEEEYVNDESNDPLPSKSGRKATAKPHVPDNVTEEEYFERGPEKDTRQLEELAKAGEAARLENGRTQDVVGGQKSGARKGGFWKRALGGGEKEKRPAIGAVTEEEYVEPESESKGKSSSPEFVGGATSAIGPSITREDSVRGELAYTTLLNEEKALEKRNGASDHRGRGGSVVWYGPSVDDDLARHMQDLLALMLPRRPGYVPQEWDPNAPSPFLDFGPIDKVAVRVRILPGGTDCPPVVFKSDGKRFRDLRHTDVSVKLREEMDYLIGLKLMPPVVIRSSSADLQVFSSMKGEDSGTLHEVGKLVLIPTREGYCAHWRCRLPASKKGDRRRMFLKLDIEGIGIVELPILAKIYSDDDRGSSTYGDALGALLYRCRADPESPLLGKVYSVDILGSPWDMNDRSKWKRPGGSRGHY